MSSRAVIRLATKEDMESIIELFSRLKMLNEEFDPMLKISNNLFEKLREYVEESINDVNSFIVIAEVDNEVIGAAKVSIRERIFHEINFMGLIEEFYVSPKYRRKGVGEKMLKYITKELERRGVKLLAASFPTRNEIAVNFYSKQGFRSLECVYAKSLD
jgi:ribosomal protein S18 acetylase RimI-like enzyme